MKYRKKSLQHRFAEYIILAGKGYWSTRIVTGKSLRQKQKASNLFYEAEFEEDPLRRIEYLSQAIALDPTDADFFMNRGIDYGSTNQPDKAEADYEKALQLSPRYPLIYNNRGYLHYTQQKYAESIPDFDRAISLDPEYITAYLNRGAAYGMMGQHERALADFNKAMEIDPENMLSYLNRGIYYMNIGQKELARQDLQKVLANEDNPLAKQYLEACSE